MGELASILPAGLTGFLTPVEFLNHIKLTQPALFAGLVGFGIGFLLCIPVGPVNLTIMNEGARRGFKWALLISAGATLMEVTYCFIAFTSLATFLTRGPVKVAMEFVTFVFMLAIGLRFLLAKTAHVSVQFGATANRIGERIEERLHPHSAFMTGLVRVMGNLGVLVFWVIFAASFISHDWVKPDWPGKLSCVGGVGLGTGLWFALLSFGASRGYGKFSAKTLLRMEHFSGICLLGLALFHGSRIIWQLVHHEL